MRFASRLRKFQPRGRLVKWKDTAAPGAKGSALKAHQQEHMQCASGQEWP